MSDDLTAVYVGFKKTELHAVQARDEGGGRIMHLARGFRFQDALAVQLSILEMGDHEAPHIGTRCRERTGRSRPHMLEIARVFAGPCIAFRHVGLQLLGQRLAHARIVHRERVEDVPVDIFVEILTGYALDDIARQRCGIVGIGWRCSRFENRFGCPALEQRYIVGHRIRATTDDGFGIFFKARRMLHQIAHGDRLAAFRGNLEIEILVDICVQIDLPLLDQLHDGGPRDQLGDRTRAEQGLLGIDRLQLFHIGIAVAALADDFAILDDHDNGTGNVGGRQRKRHIAIEPGIQIAGGQFLALRRGIPGTFRLRSCGSRIRREREVDLGQHRYRQDRQDCRDDCLSDCHAHSPHFPRFRLTDCNQRKNFLFIKP